MLIHFSHLWLFLTKFDWFWISWTDFDIVWLILIQFDLFWFSLTNFGSVELILAQYDFDLLWLILTYFDWFWLTLTDFGLHWLILTYFDWFWLSWIDLKLLTVFDDFIFGRFGIFWTLWFILNTLIHFLFYPTKYREFCVKSAVSFCLQKKKINCSFFVSFC